MYLLYSLTYFKILTCGRPILKHLKCPNNYKYIPYIDLDDLVIRTFKSDNLLLKKKFFFKLMLYLFTFYIRKNVFKYHELMRRV